MQKQPSTKDQYPFIHTLQTRWMDNDVYGHVNNVIYYSFFDTAVGVFLTAKAGLDYLKSPSVALVIETSCTYFEAVAFPDTVHVGVRVAKLGNSSVRYELAIFKNDQTIASAQGYFVHVYVDKQTQRPVPIPAQAKTALTELLVSAPN
jgi:acyl-CoA thioester hydrolase